MGSASAGMLQAPKSAPGRLCLRAFRFFFQAEDGIRDLTVTGVQTCALPISSMTCCASRSNFSTGTQGCGPTPHTASERSEEHTSELQSQSNLVCRLLLEKKKKTTRRVA